MPLFPFQPIRSRVAAFLHIGTTGGQADNLSCFPAMVNKKTLSLIGLLVALCLLPLAARGAAGGPQTKNIVITLPAETVLTSLQKVLPLDIPSQSRQLQGDIILESLDRLAIHDNIITVRGVLSGRNLMVTTRLAGQDIQLRVGEVHLPMTCDLQTRFDPGKKKLYVTPRFTDTAQNGGNPEDGLAPARCPGRAGIYGRSRCLGDDQPPGRFQVHPHCHGSGEDRGVNNALVFHLLPGSAPLGSPALPSHTRSAMPDNCLFCKIVREKSRPANSMKTTRCLPSATSLPRRRFIFW
jgi:hypothetical protein